MATPKKYFHDHFVLLLLSVNAFLAVAGCLFISLKLSAIHHNGFFVQCRDCSNPNVVDQFKTGSLIDMLALVVFAILVFVIHTALSLGVYKVHRQLAIAILSLSILLLTLTIIVSNALLVLR